MKLVPILRITDPARPWVPAANTDISVRFRVERERLAAQAERQERERAANVSHITVFDQRRRTP